jgi:RHS repeat-associated protein
VYFSLESGSDQVGSDYRRYGLRLNNNQLRVQSWQGAGFVDGPVLWDQPLVNTWYVLQITLDPTGGSTLVLYPRDNPAWRTSYTLHLTAGRTWRFRHWSHTGTILLDNYREFDGVRYQYDQGTNGVGRRTQMLDPSGWTAWQYDARGRMTQERKHIAAAAGGTFRTSWTYDAAGRARTMGYPAGNGDTVGETVTFNYNDAATRRSQLVGVSGVLTPNGTPVTYATGMRYNGYGQLTQLQYGTSPAVTQTYNYYTLATPLGQGRLHQLRAGTTGLNSTDRQNLTYSYDGVGNILSIVDGQAGGTETQSFAYDEFHRLKSATATGGARNPYGTENYSYDTVGNLTNKANVTQGYRATTPTTTCPTNLPFRPAHAVLLAGTTSYCYDQGGNLTERRAGSVITRYAYDADNRLRTVTQGSTEQGRFLYDGDGSRVLATFGAETTAYVGDYVEWSGNTLTRYYYAGKQRLAMRQGGTLYFLLGDHLGSASLTLNTNATIHSEMRYKPWGETRYPTAGPFSPTTRRFTGQIQDSATGLYYYNARYYDPVTARFTQPDRYVPNPKQPQAFNRYAYTINNPVKYTDPTGHFFESPWDAINVAIGVGSLVYNVSQGNWTDAAWDAGGLVVDIAATAIPGVPGGAATAIRAGRVMSHVDDVVDGARMVSAASDVAATANRGGNVANLVQDGINLGDSTPRDLFAVGNTSNPRSPRIEGFNTRPGQEVDLRVDNDGMVIPGSGGASTYETVEQLQANVGGHVWRLPAGSRTEGFNVIRDGTPPGHNTLQPNRRMSPQETEGRFQRLPWKPVLKPDGTHLKVKKVQKAE